MVLHDLKSASRVTSEAVTMSVKFERAVLACLADSRYQPVILLEKYTCKSIILAARR